MKVARVRLIAAAVLFVGWLGYLGFLALGHSKPVVVSRSQALVATYFVKADVALDADGKPAPRVQVRESFGPRNVGDETIAVENLGDARLPGGKPLAVPGAYLLLLRQIGPGRFEVVASPGGHEGVAKPIWVYPWGEEVERQLPERLPKAD